MKTSESDKFVSCPPVEIWIDKKEFLRSLKRSAILLNTIIIEFTNIKGEYKEIYK